MNRYYYFPFFYIVIIYGLFSVTISAEESINNSGTTEIEDEKIGNYEFYSDLKLYDFNDQVPIEGVSGDNSEVRIRLGMRFQKLFAQEYFFDSDIRAIAHSRKDNFSGDRNKAFLEIKKFNLRKENLLSFSNLSLLAGRKRLKDDRSWLYDADMDLLGIEYSETLINFEAGVAGWLWDGRIGENTSERKNNEIDALKDSWYFYSQLDYQWHYKNFISLAFTNEDYSNNQINKIYRLLRLDDYLVKSKTSWLTVKASGEITRFFKSSDNWLSYWVNLSKSNGDRQYLLPIDDINTSMIHQNIKNNYAIDFGFQMHLQRNQYFWGISQMKATGDNLLSQNNNTYYQPLIASNKNKNNEIKSFNLYGNVLSPQLSNLVISSLWAGFVFSERYWFEIAYYDYQQLIASQYLSSSKLAISPNGINTDIGTALDFFLSSEIYKDVDLHLILGSFKGGSAFDNKAVDKKAYRITVEVNARW